MARAYYLRPELATAHCIVDSCTMQPTRWSCLCQAHFMRWYLHGSFEKLAAQRNLEREILHSRLARKT